LLYHTRRICTRIYQRINRDCGFSQSLSFGWTMRIDKYICDTINITRTAVKQKISRGCVYADGQRVRTGSLQIDENACVVEMDGVKISYNKYFYIMMNKPSGVLSASSDKKCKTAIDLLDEKDKRKDLFIAGRLDKDTTGFLLITNDGDFAHNILSPKNHIYKTYFVKLEHNQIEGYKEKFLEGITIDDGYVCKSADFEYLGDCNCSLQICEGKFHQIKRMFEALGNKVVSLKRIKMGNVLLDENLEEGGYRYLTAGEVEEIMNKLHK